jgi:plasmid stabilization system protein ParE
MITVLIVEEAEHQLREIDAWWVENRRDAPDLVLQEFARCVDLLESTPDAGQRFHRTRVPGVRRLVMQRTRHHVYYVHDELHAVVYVVAVWGAQKHGAPPLRDPRR